MSGKKKKKEEKGFEIVDKRGTEAAEPLEEETVSPAAEETPAAEAPVDEVDEPGVQAAEEAPGEQAEEAPPKEEQRAADVYTIVLWMVGLLASAAWQAMGLQVNPATGKMEKDLQQASAAIDCITLLSDRISRHLDESQRREMRGLISDLQINFVNQSK